MNVVKVTKRRGGYTRVLVELAPNEPLPNMYFHDDRHYRLGHPHNEIVAGHILAAAVPVQWCSLGQEWVE